MKNIYEYVVDKACIVSITDDEGTIVHANQLFCDYAGYSIEEILGQKHSLFSSGYHSKEFYQEMWETITSQKIWRGEICNKNNKGQLYWMDTQIVPYSDQNSRRYMAISYDITEQKAFTQKVITDKETFEKTLSGSNLGFWDWYPQTNEVKFGDQWCRMLGFEPHEITPELESWSNLVHPDDIEQCLVDIKNHIEGKNDFYVNVHRMKHKTGRYLYILDKGKVIERDKQGLPLRFSGTHNDISDHVGQEKFNSYFQEVAKIGSFEYLVDFDEFQLSPNIRELLSSSIENLSMGIQNFYELFDSESRYYIKLMLDDCIKSGNSFDYEYEIKFENEKAIWLRFVVDSEMINGKVYRVLGAIQDITSFKKIQLEVQDKNLRLDLALSSAGIGIWELFPKTGVLIWDKSLFQLYGIKQTNVEGIIEYKEWEECLLEVDAISVSNEFKRCLENESYYRSEFRYVNRETNKLCYMKASATIFRDEDGVAERVVGVNWDITKEKEFSELLITAREKAEIAASAKNTFLATMSHEIRTPLNGLFGMIDLIKDTSLDEEQEDLVKTIKSCGQNLLDVVNDILDFSKIEAGKMNFEYRAFSFHDLISSIEKINGHLIKQKGIDFIINMHENTPEWIVSDEVRIKQIFSNLLSNALKFTNSGNITLDIKLREASISQSMGVLEISISDTGIGIPEDKIDRLFQSFTQVDDSTTRKFGGTGLGLAIVQSLIEFLGGKIDVESMEGQGTTFHFSLMVGVETDRKSIESERDKTSMIASDLLFEQQILVAEDNEINQKLIKSVLSKYCSNVIVVNNGQEVVEYIDETRPDLIFMDLQMPILDGLSATKIIFENDPDFSVPIIAMTANVFQEDKERCFSIGMKDFVPKPFNRSELERVLLKYLKPVVKTTDTKSEDSPLLKEAKMTSNNKIDINFEKISFEFGEDIDVFEELFNDYKNKYEDYLREICEAQKIDDFKKIEIVAHSLKGVVANFYFDPIKEVAFEMEKMGREKNTDRLIAHVDKFKELSSLMCPKLEKFIQVKLAS